jgi:hypothetical protein
MALKTYDHIDDREEAPKIHTSSSGAGLPKDILAGKVCGDCKYFSLREGQRLMEAQRFMKVLVREHGWNPKHLGAVPEALGDCGAYRSGGATDDTMITPPFAVACTQYKGK